MLKEDINEAINKKYESIRDANKRKTEARKRRLYKEYPELETIQNEIGIGGASLVAAFLNKKDPQTALSDYRKKINTLKLRKKEILNQAGYDENWLDDIYTCHKCKDTGFIDGKKCICYKKTVSEYFLEISNMKNIIKKENFSTFDISLFSDEKNNFDISPRENIEEIKKVSLNFIEEIEIKPSNLYFYGAEGIGKTFMSNCIAYELLKKGINVVYVTAYDAIQKMVKYRFSNVADNTEADEKYIEMLYESTVLIIDDLGTETITAPSKAELFTLINTRLLNNVSTIISSNIDPFGLSEIYSARVSSRILGEYNIYEFIGKDIRSGLSSEKS